MIPRVGQELSHAERRAAERAKVLKEIRAQLTVLDLERLEIVDAVVQALGEQQLRLK